MNVFNHLKNDDEVYDINLILPFRVSDAVCFLSNIVNINCTTNLTELIYSKYIANGLDPNELLYVYLRGRTFGPETVRHFVYDNLIELVTDFDYGNEETLFSLIVKISYDSNSRYLREVLDCTARPDPEKYPYLFQEVLDAMEFILCNLLNRLDFGLVRHGNIYYDISVKFDERPVKRVRH